MKSKSLIRKGRIMKKSICLFAIGVFALTNINLAAYASYFDVINSISNTAYTINSINSAARGTMSTVEYSQRFTDRQQDRKDRKRSEKEYNEFAQSEYYKTLQETQALRREYYNKDEL